MANEQRNASLGCGSLILIALIVLIFSGGNRDDETLREIRQMKAELEKVNYAVRGLPSDAAPAHEVQSLRGEVRELKREIAKLNETMVRLAPPAAAESLD